MKFESFQSLQNHLIAISKIITQYAEWNKFVGQSVQVISNKTLLLNTNVAIYIRLGLLDFPLSCLVRFARREFDFEIKTIY